MGKKREFCYDGGRVGVAISQLHGQEKRVGVHNVVLASSKRMSFIDGRSSIPLRLLSSFRFSGQISRGILVSACSVSILVSY